MIHNSYKKALCILCALISTSNILRAQDYIPDSEVLSYSAVYELSSQTSGTLKVVKTVKVNKEDGQQAATFVVTTDSFSSLSSFKGSLIPSSGKEIKIKSSDLSKMAIGEGLADDTFLSGYAPNARVPYTITYEWTISFKNGITSFPSFTPISEYNQSLDEGSYSIVVPSGTKINYYSNIPVDKQSSQGKDIYSWKCSKVNAIRHESLMPPLDDKVPHVYAVPENITYASYPGKQSSWEDVGIWMQSLLDKTEDVSQGVKDKMKDLTSGLDSEVEKIRSVYEYLGKNTRYVSLQLGVGGYRPMSCSEVEKTGFGDCKALSNYMKALLKSIGIDSYYTILSTKSKSFPEGLSTVSFMNHAMLCVPLKSSSDTLWVECTNPSYPLGYRHEDIAGHEVVYIKDGKGVRTRVGAYSPTLSGEKNSFEISLNSDGSGSIKSERSLFLDHVESYIGFQNLTSEQQNSRIIDGTSFRPDNIKIQKISSNFGEYGKDPSTVYCPEVHIVYSMESKSYAKISSSRMFVPVNPMPKVISTQRSARINDIRINGSYFISDYTVIDIPTGWEIESLPSTVELSNEWMSFQSTATRENDRRVIVEQTFRVQDGLYSKDMYAKFRELAGKIGQASSATLILKSL
ncbi:MAG: DUF3857 domain-containing protein [Bacteroidales bacterium]|nr:DUF3857 domain-containing protein [Bacteroidales bacterium]